MTTADGEFFHTDPTPERWVALSEHGTNAQLAAHPVSVGEYRDYLRRAGRPTPPALARGDRVDAPVTDVPQTDAVAYCEWLGQLDAHPYRLPTMAELLALAQEAEEEGITDEVWPHQRGHRAEVRGGLKEMFLCEWTCETEAVEVPAGRPQRVLGSIFYPPWLRHGGHSAHAQAHLLATEGFSFVTFRLARP
jgi:hypothetical protein